MNQPCPTCKGRGTTWHRQLVLPDDFEITEEFLDRKLDCPRCFGNKIVCRSCMGDGFIRIEAAYGGGYYIGCGECNRTGLSPKEKDETQEIKLCD